MRHKPSRWTIALLGAAALAVPAAAHDFGGTYKALLSTAQNAQTARTCDPNVEECSCQSGNCPTNATAGATSSSTSSGTGSQAGKTGHPIDAFTGREEHQAVDLEVPGVFPIRIIRDYDNQTYYDSPVGYGWALNYDLRVFEYPNGDVIVRSRAGTRDVYTDTDPGAGVTLAPKNPALGRIPTLEPGSAAGTYVLTYPTGMRAFFDVDGRLETLEERQGNKLLFSYCNDPDDAPPCNTTPTQKALSGMSPFAITPNALQTVANVWQLTRIREQLASGQITGRYVVLRYDASTGRLTEIESHDGRVVEYEHTETAFRPGTAASYRGNLARVIGLEGIVSEYRYPGYPLDTVISGTDIHNVTYFREGEGTEPVLNDYGTDEKVDKQTIGQMEWTYSYDAGPPVTTTVARKIVTPAAPTPVVTTASTIFEFNPEGHVTRRIDALGHQLRYQREAGRPYVDTIEVWQNGTTLVRTEDLGYDGEGNRSSRSVTLSGTGETVTESWTHFDDMIASEQVSSTDTDPNVFRTEHTFFEDDGDAVAGNGRPVNVREVKRRKSDGSFETTSFTYDGNGQLAVITPPAVTPADGLEIRRTYYTASEDGGGVIRNGHLKKIEVYVSGAPDPISRATSTTTPRATSRARPMRRATGRASRSTTSGVWSEGRRRSGARAARAPGSRPCSRTALRTPSTRRRATAASIWFASKRARSAIRPARSPRAACSGCAGMRAGTWCRSSAGTALPIRTSGPSSTTATATASQPPCRWIPRTPTRRSPTSAPCRWSTTRCAS